LIKTYRLPHLRGDIDLGQIFFSIGIFFLPSAFFVASIFLLISLIQSIFKYKSTNYFFKDKLNFFFLSAGLVMIFSALIQSFNNKNIIQYDLDISLTWIGLLNWLPFFWFYWGFKPYLNSSQKRKICGLMLLTGTFPVLLSGLGQVFFNWNGPMSTLFGLITWYQRPVEIVGGLTGLFNNQNYAGSWFNIVWPFSLAFLLQIREKIFEKISIYLFIFGLSFSIILTNSRSAWLGIVTGSILFFGKKSFGTIKIIFLFTLLILLISINPFSRQYIYDVSKIILPNPIISEFTDFQYSRIEIWVKGFETILNHPITGTGAGSFPNIFFSETNIWKGHAHNLPLELIISYGIPAGFLVLVPIFYLSFLSIKKILFKKRTIKNIIFDRAWTVSLFVLLLSQMVDVQYFDGRISIILWVLLSGSKNIIDENIISHKVD